MRTTVISTAIMALLMATRSLLSAPSDSASTELPAAQAKPVAVVSFAGYDALMEDIALVGKLSDNPDLDRGLEAMLKLFTQNRGLAGLDKSRPWGLALHTTDGKDFPGYLFVPVTDAGELAKVLEPFVGKPEQVSEQIYTIKHEGKPVYVSTKTDGWLFFSDKPERLTNTPANPLVLLGEMPKQYDLAVKVNVANVPDPLKKQFISKMRADAKRDLQQRPDEDDREYLIRKTIAQAVVQGVADAVHEVDQVLLGWKLDADVERAYMELNVIAKPGTKAAQQMAALKKSKTRMAGFRIPEAALAAHWSGRDRNVPAKELEQVFEAARSKMLSDIEKESKPEHEKEAGRMVVNGLVDAIKKTAISGESDGAMAVLLSESQATLLAGVHVADPTELEDVVKKLAKKVVEQEPIFEPWITLDAETFQGVRLHTLDLPIPADADNREHVVQVIGEKLHVVVGADDQAVYFAIGRDAMSTLKAAIADSKEKSGADLPPIEIAVSVRPWAEFVAAVGKPHERPQAQAVAEILESMVGKDHVRFVAQPVPHGVQIQVELEEGILRLMGKMNELKHANETAEVSAID